MKPAKHNLHSSVSHFDMQHLYTKDNTIKIAKQILAEIMIFRRMAESDQRCNEINCQHCALPHLFKIIAAVEQNKPVSFVLPAFPGKSPNPNKVLGYLPDYAEELSLKFLNSLSEKIKNFYQPGIKIIICSDGRVFSDVIGIQEQYITEYQAALKQIIDTMKLSHLATFNLDDVYHGMHFIEMREELMRNYSESLELLQTKIRQGRGNGATSQQREASRMYSGITRFLFEDAKHPNQQKSNTTLQKEARTKAYQVIRRSNAWSRLIAEYFPEAVRLSIHPQTCGSAKLGIRLIANESWMTPWHGVVVEKEDGVVLLKRTEAEALGAQVVYTTNGQASHYRLH